MAFWSRSQEDPRTWVGDEARRVIRDGERLLATVTEFLRLALSVQAAVDSAAKTAATQLSQPTKTPKGVKSPLTGQVAVALATGMQPSQAVVQALAARWQEQRASELFSSASDLRRTAAHLVSAAKPTDTNRLRFAFKDSESKTRALYALSALEKLVTRPDVDELRIGLSNFVGSSPLPWSAVTPELETFALARIGRTLGLQPPGREPRSVGGPDLIAVRSLAREGRIALAQRPALLDSVKKRFAAVQNRMVDRQLKEIPIGRLKEAAAGRIHFKTLGNANIATVYDALQRMYTLTDITGISHTMAQQVTAAAMQVAQAIRDDLRFRIDLDKSDKLVTGLLTALHTLLDFDMFFDGNAEQLQRATDYLSPLLSLPETSTTVTLFSSAEQASAGLEQIRVWAEWATRADVVAALQRAARAKTATASPSEVWAAFERHSASYYALLGQIVDLKLDVEAAAGFLPQDIVDRVHEQQLDESFLRASLRGYQSFGARYALVQRNVILGDEMGLGKTVQAIAVMAHLEATGHTHYLVVCPASVLINWTREVHTHSRLRAHYVHGSERDRTWRTWQSHGGVAVTTFDTLRTLQLPDVGIALLTVDEAHYIKNPGTIRARFVNKYAEKAERTLFMTGTPMENRVEEFRQLIQYLQPEVSRRLSAVEGIAGARRFREAVAPVYLRRNTDDVLQELPPMVQVEEWEEFGRNELVAYRDAVSNGNFMAMRRVAFVANPSGSTKLERLVELCDEAGANGHKVIVFSYFRDVLDVVVQALGQRAVGPLTGSVTAARRQQYVDEFSAAPGTAVLVSQIQAGGVGLNMQAGSVVVLCEPQVKPSLEAQAIARAHRMGQVRTVQVHRLLIADSVDQRMIEILDAKQQLFDEYARGSDIADASPEAIDVSEKSLARQVVKEEQERLELRLIQQYGAEEPSDTSGAHH